MSIKRKILFVTGSRGEYGYIRPLLRLIQNDKDIEFEILVTNMHLLSEFGNSLEEFNKDGLPVHYKVYNTLDGYNTVTMPKSLGIFLIQIPEILERSKPSIVLISGDRGEQLMAAVAAAHMNIPVAHIQAGEVSGNIDGNIRHAITKIAHIHFASNQDAYDRVKRLGEEEFRIFNTGAPLVDELVDPEFTDSEIFLKYTINQNKPIFLVVQHPVTEEYDFADKQMEETLKAVNEFDAEVILILPNSDAGNKELNKIINKYKTPNYHIFRNLPRADYASFMKYCNIMIGNSSSGIMEAPSFKIPVVNIGRRQIGRQQDENVINVLHDARQIALAIKQALSPKFKEKFKNCKNLYGDGKSSQRILDILKNIKIDEKLINKKITY